LEAKRILGRCRPRREDNIKRGLNEIKCDDVDWIKLGQEVIFSTLKHSGNHMCMILRTND
jgi:hypothetical protein